jgi:hypothetical protein
MTELDGSSAFPLWQQDCAVRLTLRLKSQRYGLVGPRWVRRRGDSVSITGVPPAQLAEARLAECAGNTELQLRCEAGRAGRVHVLARHYRRNQSLHLRNAEVAKPAEIGGLGPRNPAGEGLPTTSPRPGSGLAMKETMHCVV